MQFDWHDRANQEGLNDVINSMSSVARAEVIITAPTIQAPAC
jgi:hypothetical protein